MVYLRRLIWFIALRLIALCVILGMLLCGFFMALNMANVYVVLDEGMQKRAEVILTREDAQELNKYFHYDFLNNDTALAGAFDGTSAYVDYVITDFDYKLDIEKLWCWPWENYATCTVVERVPNIKGTVLSSRKNEVSSVVPKWQGGRYNITLINESGKWKIIGMQQTTKLAD